MSELLRMEHYTFRYPQQRRAALDDVSLRVEQGAFMVLCGPAGHQHPQRRRLDGQRRTRIYYCDPQASWQKPHVAKGIPIPIPKKLKKPES